MNAIGRLPAGRGQLNKLGTAATAVPDPETGELISDAEVAEISAYTAFASCKKAEQVTAWLIVRRVRDLAKPAVVGVQGELFPVRRYYPSAVHPERTAATSK